MRNRSLPALLILCATFTACTPSCTRDSLPDAANALQIQLSSEPVSLDPGLAEDGLALKILCNLMDGLVGYDAQGKLENRLAASVIESRDGLRYDFILRPDARWSDGHPVTADDFVTGLRRSLNPKTPSKLAPMLYPIRGARAFHDGKIGPDGLGVSSSQEGRQLTIELETPNSSALELLTLPPAMPVRQDVLASHSGKWAADWPVTGPYQLGARKQDQYQVLVPNKEHWAHHDLLPVVLWIITDESTAANLFEKGKLDILTKIPAYDIKRYEQKGVLHTDPFVASYYLGFNTRKAPFNDREWRRAVSGAIDRKGLIDALGTGEMPARSWVPRGLEGYIPYSDPAPVFASSASHIRAEMKRKPQRIEIGFDSSGRNSTILEKVQSDLSRGLGLKTELQSMDWKSYVRQIHTDPPQIFRFGWLAPFLDPISHLMAFTSGDPNNATGWSNARYDRLVREISAMGHGPKREAKVREAQTLLVDQEAVIVPLYHYVQTHAVSARVEGFKVSPFGVIRFEGLLKN